MKDKDRKYYHAYDERYKAAHGLGVSWAGSQSTPIVMETIKKYHIEAGQELLEIGCGEGRDAIVLLESGYSLMATDVSEEAVSYCRKNNPGFAQSFFILDCLSDKLEKSFDFIYAVAVIHMLVQGEDREGFYRFIYEHLKPEGIALVCTMGDGNAEMQSDISKAFEIQERDHFSGKMLVACTSCRMVSFDTFERELKEGGFTIIEQGITSAMPDFDNLMYAVVKRS